MAKVSARTIVADDAAVASVKVDMYGFHGQYTGASKKHPKDSSSQEIGEALALARAMREAAEDLEDWVTERVENLALSF